MDLVVILDCLVVKMKHLDVILIDLVVKNTDLILEVK